jgi:hypothetical protein
MKRAVFLGTSIVSTSLVERRSEFDPRELESALGRPAQVKQMWENVALRPGVFGNIKNALNGLIFGYGYAPGAIAMAVVNHGPSSAYTYDDSIWTKYRVAEFLGYQQPSYDNPFASAAARVAQSLGLSHPGGAPLKNTFYARRNPLTGPSDPDDEKSPYQDTSIEALQRRGVAFLLCHTAVVEQARGIRARRNDRARGLQGYPHAPGARDDRRAFGRGDDRRPPAALRLQLHHNTVVVFGNSNGRPA